MERFSIVVILLLYLVGLGIFLGFVGASVQEAQYNSQDISLTAQELNPQYVDCDCGVLTCTEYEAIYGAGSSAPFCSMTTEAPQGFVIVTGIQALPTWLNLIFITIPVVILGFLIASFFIPFVNIGG